MRTNLSVVDPQKRKLVALALIKLRKIKKDTVFTTPTYIYAIICYFSYFGVRYNVLNDKIEYIYDLSGNKIIL